MNGQNSADRSRDNSKSKKYLENYQSSERSYNDYQRDDSEEYYDDMRVSTKERMEKFYEAMNKRYQMHNLARKRMIFNNLFL
jgi:hypothetical protein